MEITLDHVVPAPLRDLKFSNSLWDSYAQFKGAGSYLVKAISGKGKTTLIHLLFGIRNDYAGTIRIDNRDVREFSRVDRAVFREKSCSIVLQDLGLFPQLTGRENIMVKYKLASPLNESSVFEMAERIGISGILDQQCCKMSLGQQQRVAIIRALVPSFNFLLLDEPFSHLDLENICLARELITHRCNDENAGLILTSLNDDYGFSFNQIYEI